MRSLIALTAALSLLAASNAAHAREGAPASPPLPVDERFGVNETLPNGMKLYVRKNETPKKLVSLWLRIGVGSLAETIDERGMAHYLEHIAFRGSANFPPGSLSTRFQDLGVRFGRDQNARTGFDETSYILSLPIASPKALSEGLTFLADVASRLSLLEGEIEDERGVILEEGRVSAGPQLRIMKKVFEAVAPGSLIATRLPIGEPEVVKVIDAKAMRAFYEKWYRPESSALIIVGDVDPEVAGSLARVAFAGWQRPASPTPTYGTGVGEMGPLSVQVVTDPEEHSMQLGVLRMQPVVPRRTEADYRRSLIRGVASSIANRRFADRKRAGAAYLDGEMAAQRFVANLELVQAGMECKPDQWRQALGDYVQELKRLHVHGVLDSEIKLSRDAMLSALEAAVERAGAATSSEIVARVVRAVAVDREPMSEAQRLALAKRLLPTITAQEVHAVIRGTFGLETGKLMVTVPQKPGVEVPSSDEIRKELDTAWAQDVAAPEASATVETLIAAPSEPGKVVKREHHEGLKATRLIFENGVVALVRPVPSAGQVVGNVALFGGTVFEDASSKGRTAITVGALAGEHGRTKLRTASQISDYFADKKMNVSLAAANGRVSFGMGGSLEDLAAGFEYVRLMMDEGLVTDPGLAQVRESLKQQLDGMTHSTQAQAIQRMRLRVGGEDPRLRPMTHAELMRDDVATAQAWWKEICSTAPVEVVLSGAIDVEQAEALVATWMGSLPARPADAWARYAKRRNITPALTPGGENIHVETITPTAVAVQGWTGLDRAKVSEMATAMYTSQVLSQRLYKEVRESRGLTYSIQAMPMPSEYRGLDSFVVFFTAEAARLDEAAKVAKQTVDTFASDGPTEQEIAGMRMAMTAQRMQIEQQPGIWLQLLSGLTVEGYGLERGAAGPRCADGGRCSGCQGVQRAHLQGHRLPARARAARGSLRRGREA